MLHSLKELTLHSNAPLAISTDHSWGYWSVTRKPNLLHDIKQRLASIIANMIIVRISSIAETNSTTVFINGPQKMSLIRLKVAVFPAEQAWEITCSSMRKQAGGCGWSRKHAVKSTSIYWTSVPFTLKTQKLRFIPSKVRLAALNLNLIRNSFKWSLTYSVNSLL